MVLATSRLKEKTFATYQHYNILQVVTLYSRVFLPQNSQYDIITTDV